MKDETPLLAGPALCATTAQLLRAGAATLAPVGGALALLAAAALLLMLLAAQTPVPLATAAQATAVHAGASVAARCTMAAWCAVLLLAPIERVLALRVRFDAGLFAELAADGALGAHRLEALDHALHALGLRPRTAAVRPLDDRVRGARALLLKHAGVVALQALAAAGALACLLRAAVSAGAG